MENDQKLPQSLYGHLEILLALPQPVLTSAISNKSSTLTLQMVTKECCNSKDTSGKQKFV